MEKHQVHIIVSGRVQGVFFRDFTYRTANSLGLAGWVQNTHQGKVEIIAEGEKDKLEQLIKAVSRGPSSAKVTDCQVEWKDFIGEYKFFEIIY